MNDFTDFASTAAEPATDKVLQLNAGTHRLQRFKLHKLCRSCRKDRRGAAVVEFALVAPIFFLLVFGMIEYGRMVMVQQVLTNASREGARRAVLDGAQQSTVISSVRTYLTNASINGQNPNLTITVTPAPESAVATDQNISVTVQVPFADVSWLPSPMFLQNKSLRASSVMRREELN